MSRKTLLGAGAAVLAAILLYFFWPRSSAGVRSGEDTDDSLNAAEILAQRRAARREGSVDVRPGSLSGRVVDDRGRPVAGAVVSVGRKSFDLGSRSRAGVASEPLIAAADEGGAWTIGDLDPGRYTLAATARGYRPASLDGLELAAGQARTDVVVTLARGGHLLTGVVSDIGGGPVPGAIVRATSLSEGASVMDFFRAPYSTRADEEGRYALPLGNGVYGVQVQHPDYVSANLGTEIRDGDRTLDVTLSPAAVIWGRVLRRGDDTPMADATVVIQPDMRRGGESLTMSLGVAPATTDAEGRFELRGLTSGTISLRAFGRGFASREPTQIELGIAEQIDGVVVYVDQAFSISGFVVDKGDHGRGLEGVLLGAFNFGGAFQLAQSPSAPDGYFEIHGLQPGSYIVGAAGEGHVVSVMGANVMIKDADVDDVLVELDGGVTVSGRVEPPGAARILVEIDPENIGFGNMMQVASMAFVRGEAGPDGLFTLRAVPRAKLTLVATADDGSEGRAEVDATGGDQSGVVIRLEQRASVAGIVVDETSQPVAGVRVVAAPMERSRNRFTLDFAALVSGGGPGGGATGITQADGSFRIVGLEAGSHMLTVRDDRGRIPWADAEHKDTPTVPIEVEVAEGQAKGGLRLVVEARNQRISGIVLGPDGQALADAWVTARAARMGPPPRRRGRDRDRDRDRSGDAEAADYDWRARPESPVLTDAQGRFLITNLRAGTYHLEAEGLKGNARGETKDVRTGTDTRITLERLAGIEGKVTHPRGEPVSSYILEVGGMGGRRVQVANPEGTYRVNRLEPGDYTLSVIAPDGRAGGKVTVKANQTARHDMQLVAWGSVSGRVVDASTGEPMDGLIALASTDEGTDWAELAMGLMTGEGPRTGTDGRFRVERLGAGSGQLGVVDGDAAGFELVASRSFSLEPGQHLDLGDIRGTATRRVPQDERGDLGMTVIAVKWSGRPRTADSKGAADDPPPDGVDPDADLLWVGSVDEGGAAERAGVRHGDRITAINNVPVDAIGAEVARQLLSPSRIRAGEAIGLALERDGSPTSATVTPTPKAAE